jgi:hypothetical protein
MWLEVLRRESDNGIISRGSVEVLRAIGSHGTTKGLRLSDFHTLKLRRDSDYQIWINKDY